MIITESKPYGMIKTQLKKTDKIGIVACNACARWCETGGEKKLKELVQRLKKDGYNVVDQDLIGFACNWDQLKAPELHGTVILVLACDAGVYNLKKLFPKRKIVPGLTTVGLGAWDQKGNLHLVKRFK